MTDLQPRCDRFELLCAALLLLCCAPGLVLGRGVRFSEQRLEKMHNVIMCYADWSQCDAKVLTGAEQGCNVIVWFAINIRRNETSGQPMIMGGPAPECVASVAKNLSEAKLDTLHLISIGGWDQAHPDTSFPAFEVWEAFKSWNENSVARLEWGFEGYDGIDWDVEGADSPTDPANFVSVGVLDLVGEMSKMAKKEGYVVSMAPMESYLDPTTSQFNRSLLQTYPEWSNLAPKFAYHGRNVYAYLLAKHGEWWSLEESLSGGTGAYFKKKKRTFDLISIQLYETFSHANYAILHQHVDPAKYLAQAVARLTKGWIVDFSTDPEPAVSQLGMQSVRVHKKQLVLGAANAWAGVGEPVKALYLTPLQLRDIYKALLLLSLPPRSVDLFDPEFAQRDSMLVGSEVVPTWIHGRGIMFWSLKFEGLPPANSTTPLYLAAALNAILCVRPTPTWQHDMQRSTLWEADVADASSGLAQIA